VPPLVFWVLGALMLEKHPDKTFIGRIERGFDFLGYHFSPAGMKIAAKTIANFIEKASRLYEQKRSAVSAATALEMYVRRWVRWTTSGRVDLLHLPEGLVSSSALKWVGSQSAVTTKSEKDPGL